MTTGTNGELLRLLTYLRKWSPAPDAPSHLIMVSFDSLGMTKEEQEKLNKKLSEAFQRFCFRREAVAYRISTTDTALLVKLNEYNQLESTSELKVDLIRVIQQNFQVYFNNIDQSRLVRVLNLQGRLQNVIKFLETVDDRKKESGIQDDGTRTLRESDIQAIRDIQRQMGRKTFAENFIRNQKTALITPGKQPAPLMAEYFISFGMIQQHILKNVDFKGATAVFSQLTRALDQMVIDCFSEINPGGQKCSLNLNVETVFTHSFQNLLEKGGAKALSNVVLKFRQENILQNWDQFKTGSELIKSKGGTIAVDAIIPETIGLVDLRRLDAGLAKVFWREGSETILPRHKGVIRSMQEKGIVMVLARVDNELGVKTGQACGITMFQGFHVDNLII